MAYTNYLKIKINCIINTILTQYFVKCVFIKPATTATTAH